MLEAQGVHQTRDPRDTEVPILEATSSYIRKWKIPPYIMLQQISEIMSLPLRKYP